MLKVGLTGGIAVGKSFVSNILRELGAQVFDADQIARTVVAPGTPALADIIAEFGADVSLPDGTLDRAKLGARIFQDESARLKLNAIVHPHVHAEQNRLLAEVEQRDPNAVAVIDAALLIESGGYKRFDKIVVVWCDLEKQIERLMRRNSLSRDEALRRIESQMPAEEKRRFADYEINTSRTHDDTRRHAEAVFFALQALAQADATGTFSQT